MTNTGTVRHVPMIVSALALAAIFWGFIGIVWGASAQIAPMYFGSILVFAYGILALGRIWKINENIDSE